MRLRRRAGQLAPLQRYSLLPSRQLDEPHPDTYSLLWFVRLSFRGHTEVSCCFLSECWHFAEHAARLICRLGTGTPRKSHPI